MKDDSKIWLRYAEENFKSSQVLLQSELFNPSLQNAQQAVEKALKAVLIKKNIRLKRTHDILEIKQLLSQINIEIDLSEDECDFLNSIYLPSKYPVGSALADYEPNRSICEKAIELAERTIASLKTIIK